MATILCIDDEPAVGVVLEHHLAASGHDALLAGEVNEGLRILDRQQVDLILCDYRMPGPSGLDLLDMLREHDDSPPVIIMTAHSSIEHAVTSIRRGAVDYLTKPLRSEALRLAIDSALEISRLRRENAAFRREIQSLRGPRLMVGESQAFKSVLATIAAVAGTGATVLIEGESGTGKELIARAIHEQSPRRERPFITVNCAAMPEGLVESTLFGHERGAFTGATQRSPGAFERADRGTLLLDEISEMRLDLQAKLLRALQEQQFERVGGTQTLRVDVRVIATTNRNLKAAVEARHFRQDLYYRLSVVPLSVPSLRERVSDIPLLAEHFARQAAARLRIKPRTLLPDALDYLSSRSWPGNVRELANAVERAMILHQGGDSLEAAAFGATDAPGPASAAVPARDATPPTPDASTFDLATVEADTIQRALAHTGGHRTRAARLLGISERTLRSKLNSKK